MSKDALVKFIITHVPAIATACDRNRTIIRNSAINYCIKLSTYALNLLSIPLALKVLGKEQYGIFITVLTIISWAYLANLGIGNGLRNKITEYTSTNRESEIKRLIGTAILISVTISVTMLALGLLAIKYYFRADILFCNTTVSPAAVSSMFKTIFTFFCVSLTLGLSSSIAFGIQKSYLSTAVQLIHISLYSCSLYIINKLQIGATLAQVAYAYGFFLCLAQAFPLIGIINNKRIWSPVFKIITNDCKVLLSTSIGFFILQLSAVALFSADNFIIAKLLGASKAAEYSIINGVFFTIINIFSILLIQMWNATTEAYSKKDFAWIRQSELRLKKLLTLVLAISVAIALSFNVITLIWLGESINFSTPLRLLFATYTTIHCLNAIYANMLNGIGRLRAQTLAYILAAAINISLSYVLIRHANLGIISVIISKTICVTMTALICIYDYKTTIKHYHDNLD